MFYDLQQIEEQTVDMFVRIQSCALHAQCYKAVPFESERCDFFSVLMYGGSYLFTANT